MRALMRVFFFLSKCNGDAEDELGTYVCSECETTSTIESGLSVTSKHQTQNEATV